MYLRLMMIAFLVNGLGTFGMHMVSETGSEHVNRLAFMSLWYVSGCVLAAAAYYWNNRRLLRRELLVGGAMGVCSFCGVNGMTLALAAGVPGFVVFPVAMGGGLLMVVATGIGLFRERMGPAGYLGIGLGMLALVLLALP
jgi:drug/metabolite transporter (DMT)-like permease